MRAIAKRFLRRSSAAAERHAFFNWILVSLGVDQLYFARDDVRTVLDCFDSYLSHVLTLSLFRLSCRAKSKHLWMFPVSQLVRDSSPSFGTTKWKPNI